MKNRLAKLLCLIFVHKFETVDKQDDHEAVVCERCGTCWLVDHTLHTMEPLKEVV